MVTIGPLMSCANSGLSHASHRPRMSASGVVKACRGESLPLSLSLISFSLVSGLDVAGVRGVEDNGVVLDAEVEAPRGVLCLDRVGVVSVDPGMVERRFDLGVTYGFIMDDGGGDAAEKDPRVVGTGIRLRLCCGGLVGVICSVFVVITVVLNSVFM